MHVTVSERMQLKQLAQAHAHTVKGGGEEKKNIYSVIGTLLAEYCILLAVFPISLILPSSLLTISE